MKKYLLLCLLAVPLFQAGCGIEIVDAGHTGVEKKLGEIKADETYPPGLYFVNPLTTNIIHMDNRVQKSEGSSQVYTKDVQKASIQYVVNYSLSPAASGNILINIGKDYEQKIIPQVMLGGLKNIIGQWDAIELIANQQKAGIQIEGYVSEKMEEHGILVQNLELTAIQFEHRFEEAVEAKVTAVQRAEEAKNNTVRVQEEANQRIIAAKADAEAMAIKTDALEKSQSLIMYEAVQKWNGVMPRIISGDGSGTLLNIPESALQ